MTSADRGTLLKGRKVDGKSKGLRKSDIKIWSEPDGSYSGTIYIEDTKSAKRSRTVPITDSLCRELLYLCHGKKENDTVFDMEYSQLDFPWKQVRKEAALTGIRFKDLRAQTSIAGEKAGVPLTVVQKTMGHKDEKMTRRYQKREVSMSAEQAKAIEDQLFGDLAGRKLGRKRSAAS